LECSFENIDESLHTQCIKFWFKDILPLLFDAEDEIKEAAIDAVSAFVPQLKFTKYQTMTIWNSTKTAIVDKYVLQMIVERVNILKINIPFQIFQRN
jgi:hypothetical protein